MRSSRFSELWKESMMRDSNTWLGELAIASLMANHFRFLSPKLRLARRKNAVSDAGILD